MKRVYIISTIVAAVVVIIICYLMYTKQTNEAYVDYKDSPPFNLIVIDGNGNMSSVAVNPPSLAEIPSTSNIVYVDASGNIGTMSVGSVYTSYKNKNVRNLLKIDSNNNFSVISSLNFNPCHMNSDGTMNGVPQRDGTCICRNNWSGKTKGDGCAVCDGAGPDCEYSHSLCNGHGKVNNIGECICDRTYGGKYCLYNDAEHCLGRGNVQTWGEWFTCVNCTGNWDPKYSCKMCKPGLVCDGPSG
jgi:hypothetical protein